MVIQSCFFLHGDDAVVVTIVQMEMMVESAGPGWDASPSGIQLLKRLLVMHPRNKLNEIMDFFKG
jgi:hypothetical protein